MRVAVGIAALTGLGLALTAATIPASAQGTWCAEDMNARNCGFYTLEQCRAAASGTGGNCYRSPYVTAPAAAAPRRAKPAKPRH